MCLLRIKNTFSLCVILQIKMKHMIHNFERRRMQAEIKTFLKIYSEKLKRTWQ